MRHAIIEQMIELGERRMLPHTRRHFRFFVLLNAASGTSGRRDICPHTRDECQTAAILKPFRGGRPGRDLRYAAHFSAISRHQVKLRLTILTALGNEYNPLSVRTER